MAEYKAVLISGDIFRHCMRYSFVSNELIISAGGRYEISFGANSGTRTVTVKLKTAIGNDQSFMKIIQSVGRDPVSTTATAVGAGTGDWETLTVSFLAEKKVYIARLGNAKSGGADAYFDDFTVE